jgi:hypothetical protein
MRVCDRCGARDAVMVRTIVMKQRSHMSRPQKRVLSVVRDFCESCLEDYTTLVQAKLSQFVRKEES